MARLLYQYQREVVKQQATVQLKYLQKEKSESHTHAFHYPLTLYIRDTTGKVEGFQRNATESKPASLLSVNNILTGIFYIHLHHTAGYFGFCLIIMQIHVQWHDKMVFKK